MAGCLADRATLCNFYSWPGSASSQYWGGYFVDARDSWGTMMYPLNERRFYTVGENCGRYEKIRYFETFLPANEITKVYGAMRTSDDCGPPFMSAFLHLYPHIAFIHASPGLFHGKVHASNAMGDLCVPFLKKNKAAGLQRLSRLLEGQRSNLSLGKVSTNGNTLFEITKR